MTDGLLKGLLVTGSLLQVAALGLGFSSLGWRWPLIAAGAAAAAGSLLIVLFATNSLDTFQRSVLAANLAVLALAAWHGLSPAPVAAILYRIAFGLQAVCLLAITMFALTFRMTRLF